MSDRFAMHIVEGSKSSRLVCQHLYQPLEGFAQHSDGHLLLLCAVVSAQRRSFGYRSGQCPEEVELQKSFRCVKLRVKGYYFERNYT